jgi:uncharacterized caspase-like protein
MSPASWLLWRRLCEQFDVCEMSATDISVALVIGVSKYRYLTPLESTQNDARELADFLLDSGEFEQVILLTEEDATKRAIEYFMEDYIPTFLQGHRRRSRFLFCFSGHGERRPGTRPGLSAPGKQSQARLQLVADAIIY